MKTKYTIPVMVSTAVLLAACGGGGNTVSSITGKSYQITGTVPGTLIEAFCEDGSYHSVNSDNNGTTKHPFALELPADLSCRLVMTTNENDPAKKVITPITFTNKDGVTSIAFSGSEDIDIDHVDLALDRTEMTSDTNSDGVEDEPTEVVLATGAPMNVIETANDPLDKDNDGIINVYEDDDEDGINNHDDDDDDNDGVLDKDDSDNDDDLDGDGIDNTDDVDDDNDGTPDNGGNNGGNMDPVVMTPSAGRLLASQCAQCHRTDGNPDKGFEDLIGEDIFGELTEMKMKNKQELMHLQAKGYSDAQIRLMDDYFKSLSGTKGGK